MSPSEQEARQQIDALLAAAGWSVQDAGAAHIHAARGMAIREFPLPGHGFADYLLYVDGKAAGVIEAKKVGTTLTGVEVQSNKYTQGLPAGLPRWHIPLPFCYESTGDKPENLIAAFRSSYNPRIAVTVDMIATGTDIKAVECVFFMRSVKSRAYFEQMKGRGVRIINDNDLQAVTPDAVTQDHFAIVDAVGVCEMDQTDSLPLERKKNVGFEKLLQAVAFGNAEVDVVSSVAARLARMEKTLTPAEQAQVSELLGGRSLKGLTGDLVEALDADNHRERAQQLFGVSEPDDKQRKWLEMIRDHIAANPQIETEDFDYAPFAQEGGIGNVWQVSGEDLQRILEELNETLAA